MTQHIVDKENTNISFLQDKLSPLQAKQIVRQEAVMSAQRCEIDLSAIPFDGELILAHGGKDFLKIVSKAGVCEIHTQPPQDFYFTQAYKGHQLQVNSANNVFFQHAQQLHSLQVNASSVKFENKLTCSELKVVATEMVSIKSDVLVQNHLDIEASVIKNTGRLKTLGNSHAKMTAKKTFYADPKSSNIFRGGLQLTTDNCQIKGKWAVLGESEIQAKRLDTENLFKLTNLKNMSVSEWNQYQGARTKIDTGTIQVTDTTRIAAGAEMQIQGGTFASNQIQSHGKVDLSKTRLDSEKFLQKSGETHFLDNAFLNLHHFEVENGDVSVSRAQLYADRWIQQAGKVELESSDVTLKNTLETHKQATTKFKKTKLSAKKILAFGQLHLDKTIANVEDWHHEGLTELKDSNCVATKAMKLNHHTTISHTVVKSENLSLSGDLTVLQTKLEAKTCTLIPDSLTLSNTLLQSDTLAVYKGEKFEKEITATQVEINTGNILLNSDLKLIKSKLITRSLNKNKRTSQGLYGNLTLEDSLLQTDKEVQIFSSTGAKIKAVNSEIKADEIYSWGSLTLQDSQVESNVLHQSTHELQSQRSHIKTKEFSVDGQITADESQFAADTIGFSGNINLRASAVAASSETFIHQGAQVKTNTATIRSQQMNVQGGLNTTTSSLQVENEMFVGKDAHFDQNHAQAQVGNLWLHGKLTEKNAAISAKNDVVMSHTATAAIDGGVIRSGKNTDIHGSIDLSGRGLRLKADGHVLSSETAQIHGSQLDVDSITWTHRGDVEVDGLTAKGKRFYNLAGSIEAKNATFGYDHFWLNALGGVSADNLTVHSNMLNVGYSAATNMQVSGFVNANFGLIAAKNYQESGLVSLNTGGILGSNVSRSALLSANFGGILAVPTLPRTPGELFSWNNVSRVINVRASVYTPQVAGLVNLGTHVVNSLIHLPETIKTVKNISSKIANVQELHLHELMPLINQTKDLAMSAAQFTSVGYKAWGNCNELMKEVPIANNAPEASTRTATLPTDVDVRDAIFVDQILSQAGNLFGGNVTDESLFGYNAGSVYAKNYTAYGYDYHNAGDLYAWDSLAVNSTNIHNTGDAYGGNHVGFTAKNMENSGNITADESMKMDVDNVLDNTESGSIISKGKTDITTNTFNQEGNAVLHNGKVKADTMNIGTGHNDYVNLHIKGTALNMAESHRIHTHNVMIDESHIRRGAGDWQVDGWTQVNTKDYQSAQGATITVAPKSVTLPENTNQSQTDAPQTDAPQTDAPQTDAPQTDAPQTDAPQTDAPQTDTQKPKAPPPENIFVLQAEKGQVSDKIQGGEAAVLAIQDVTFKNAELNGNVYAQGKNAKIAAGEKLSVDGGHLNYETQIDQQGDLALKNGSLKTAELILGGQGHNDFSHADINATKLVMEKGHQVNTDTTDLVVNTLTREQGAWKNQGHTNVLTDDYTSASGATITNKQSENNATSNQNESEEKSQEKPAELVNQFYLSAKKGTVGDTVSGGDRTVLNIDDTTFANAKLNGNVYCYANNATIAEGSSLERNGGYSDFKHFTNNGHLSSKNHQQQGDTFTTHGTMDTQNDIYDMKGKITLRGIIDVEDTAYLSKTTIDDKSQLTHTGQAIFEAEDYEHSGSIKTKNKENKKNTLFVTATRAKLAGKAKTNNAVYKVNNLKNASDFATGNGQYKNYQMNDSFELETQEKIDIDETVRNCDLTLTGSEINVNKAIKMNNDVSLTSTQKDINIQQDISVNNFYADSARDIKNNSDVQAKNKMGLEAKRNLHNYGGKFSAKKTYAKAQEILNIHKKSAKAGQFKDQKIGKSGAVIEGKEEALLESTKGNIENHGGIIQSGGYTQLVSANDVKNICNERTRQGKYDTEKSYQAAEIRGGAGSADTHGVGLHVEAAGKVHSDGSNFVSQGDNYISGKKGVDFKARHHTNVSHKETRKKLLGSVKKEIVETSTTVQSNNVVSEGGRNIIYSEQGDITGQATHFIAKGGTDVFADKKGIKLSSLITEDRSSEKNSYGWGIAKNSRKESHENATPTVFVGSGKTRLRAKEDVDCKGVVFAGDGHVHLKGKNVRLSRDVLNHTVEKKSHGFSVGAFGVNAASTMKNKGNPWEAIASEDPTLGKANALLHSQTLGQGLANGWNLGVNAYNTTNAIASGISNNNLGGEALARYGLGGLNGFDPTVNINLHQTHTKAKYQTTGPGELNNKNVTIEGENKIILENGYQVKASENVTVNAKKIEAHAAKLKSSMHRKETTYSVSASASAGVSNVGVKRSVDKINATNHENAGIHAGKTMTINAEKVIGNGLNLNAHDYAGHINNLTLKNMQDTYSNSSKSMGINSNGMVNVSKSNERGKVTNQQSGLHATGDLSNKNLKIDHAHLVGAGITADGKNNLKIDSLIAETPRDEIKRSGFSLTGNVNDVNRLLGNERPVNGNEPSLSKPVIDTLNISVQRSHQIVEHDSTIYGAQGTQLEIKNQTGYVNTQSANNTRVIKDENTAISLDVPMTTLDRLDTANKNITHAWNKILPKSTPVIPITQVPLKPELNVEAQPKENLKEQTEDKMQEETLQEATQLQPVDPAIEQQSRPQEIPVMDLDAFPNLSEAEIATLPVLDPKALSPELISMVKICKKGVGEATEVLLKVVTQDGTAGLLPAVFTVRKIQFLYNFGFNMALQDGAVTGAALDTVSDFIVSKGIQKLALGLGCRAAAGPIGWTMFVSDIMNELVVKQDDTSKIADQSVGHRVAARESIRNGNFWEYQYEREMANAKQQQWQSFETTRNIAAFSNWLTNFVTFRNPNNANTDNQQAKPSEKNTLRN